MTRPTPPARSRATRPEAGDDEGDQCDRDNGDHERVPDRQARRRTDRLASRLTIRPTLKPPNYGGRPRRPAGCGE
ncbi:hypothetical protein [Alloactinosynnema sp. L-07]|nr:hypothetical protein [Alloactinosynnema sp. L-07]